MSEQLTSVLLASNILRRPDLFDGLGPPAKKGEGEHRVGRRKEGAATGGLCRDLVLYAALNKHRVVEFRLPDFCKEMGYYSQNLMRRCTDEQIAEIRRSGSIDEEDVETFSNMLGLALVRLVRHTFIFPDKGDKSKHKRFSGKKIVEHVDVFKPQKSGTVLSFTLSEEVLEHNRKVYQVLYKEEYLSLRTQSSTRKLGHPGHPDDAARRMYMRLRWRRGYWEHLIKEGLYEEAKKLEVDSYTELLQVAGLSERSEYWEPKRIAFELRKLLNRVASMDSILLVPTVALSFGNKYEVTWKRTPFPPGSRFANESSAQQPRPNNAPQPGPAAKPTRTKSKPTTTPTLPTSAPKKPASAPAPAAPPRPDARKAQKLRNEQEDLTNSLQFLESDAAKNAKDYKADPAKLAQAIADVMARLDAVQNELQLS
jgi:hypothetical protein